VVVALHGSKIRIATKMGRIPAEVVVGYQDHNYSHWKVAGAAVVETCPVAQSFHRFDFLHHNRLLSLLERPNRVIQAVEVEEASGMTMLHLRFHRTIGESVEDM